MGLNGKEGRKRRGIRRKGRERKVKSGGLNEKKRKERSGGLDGKELEREERGD